MTRHGQERSRPTFDVPEGDRHGRWTTDTPVSRRRLQEQPPKKAQRPADVPRPALARSAPSPKELEQIAAQAMKMSQAGLVRTVEQQQAYRSGMNKLANSHPKTKTKDVPGRFSVDKSEAIADPEPVNASEMPSRVVY